MTGKTLDSTERITVKYGNQERHEISRMKGFAAILGVLVLMVVVTACGSGESSTTPATNSSATFIENASGNTGASQAANESAAQVNWFTVIAAVSVGLGVLGTVFWIWMLVDCATEEPDEGNNKVVWTLIIVFTHLIGVAPDRQ